MKLTILNPKNPEQAFPSVTKALKEPDGLLAIGGCLSKKRLVNAYRQGIFPWYNPGEPILWWSPDPRLVLFPEKLLISRSLRKTQRQHIFSVTLDQAFDEVINGCAQPRPGQSGTWITKDIKQAYAELFRLGIAHSAETWLDGKLVGGLYGIALGQVFFGESMFHTQTDASKIAFAALVGQLKSWDYRLIDCQVHSQHLVSLGAEEIPRDDFVQWLDHYCDLPASPLAWRPL
ncbi:MAG: leucyl/phenylalanyl-tRNA--protein transferase [Methylovulum sp.]|uniref:leucyl/phenylalanyl-tRNA--protein transferase n=1 Tax=Methylovulum sp. TaxID=1916980 RepID=UPI00261591CA|nr:leucyl/phenylalanyl-tRNA--protein transferase [Methylovulum sp.]MDD2723889.1 leucyl/phenylalanyl-tRNA--protein transferase [Methylovulum sp.]MDD5125482.1 leucyl/phenylalanyl-tRNA--protein transferase [Methylovulum sp.]